MFGSLKQVASFLSNRISDDLTTAPVHATKLRRNIDDSSAFNDTLPFLVISVICFVCFVHIPGRLAPSYPSHNMIRALADAHWCVYMWVIYDFGYSFIYGLLPFLSFRECAVVTSSIFLAGIVSATYFRYINLPSKQLLRKGVPGRSNNNQSSTNIAAADLEKTEEAVPFLTWMMVWSLGFMTCFAWVKGINLVIRTVVPGSIFVLIFLLVVIP